MDESIPAIWVVHDGRGDEAEDIFDQGRIAVGWDDLGDLRLLKTEGAIRGRLATFYGGASSRVLTTWARQLYGFTYDMKIGDIVVYPRTQDQEIRLGRITGSYHYVSDRKRFRSEREVEWVKVLPRTAFSKESLTEFAHQYSCFRVKNTIQEVLLKYGYLSETPEIRELREFLEVYRGKGYAGQGFKADVEERIAIEQYAMTMAEAYYREQGWSVNPDVHKNEPYDLHCTRSNDEELRVEVKGTTSAGMNILLTEGEVKHARKHANVALFIVANIALSSTSGKLEPSGGTTIIRQPWHIDDGQLTPLAYKYTIPRGSKA
ncbi:MAG: protein NO VEIN domain-containing protein [Thermomicrobiales bacterium]